MGSKNKKQRKLDGGDAAADRQIITDPRFASAHTDPRFRRAPKRETKVAIDSRFKGVFTDKRFGSGSAPVDKRGKRKTGGSGKDSLREYYRMEEEPKKHNKDEDDSDGESEEPGSESESEMDAKSGLKSDSSGEEDGEEEESEEEDGEEGEEEEVSTSEEEDDDAEGDDDIIYEGGRPELVEENIPEIEKETRRLAIVNMDWTHVSASDLYVMLSSFLPKDGQILSVAVYPSEFGLQRMKEEEVHGPVGLFDGDKKNEDDEEDEDEDEDIINQKLRAYEISRLKYYYAVVECDSSATADYLYKTCDGVEFERSSNKLDLRFIPDSMGFKHPPRDIATEAPANYEGLDFHSRALQLSKVNLSWDEDEPHRAKTLKRKFKPDQLAELELKEFLASDESESDDDEDKPDKKEKMKDKYRALIQSGDNGSDEEEEDKDQDMEVTFNTELEDLSKRILEKKDKKSETVWEAYLSKRREKKKARKNKQNKDDSSSSDDDAYGSDTDREAMKEGPDDFFVEEPPAKRKKEGKKNLSDKAEKEAAEEASRAELELLLADEKAGDGGGTKGYNIKRKGKKGKAEIAEEKIPAADLDDPRFSRLFTSPLFALDPTDPHFKRSAAYARQLAQKQNGDLRSSGGSDETTVMVKPQFPSDETAKSDTLGSKREKHELSSAIRSVKMKLQQKDTEKKQGRQAESSAALVQRIKKKAKALTK